MKIKNHWLNCAHIVKSPNYDSRTIEQNISLIVIHCISLPEGKFNTPYIEQFFTNQLNSQSHPSFAKICHLEVSSHILINRTGSITQFVAFNKRAWHAGISEYQGHSKCNDFSIGIELEGTDYLPYTEIQYTRLAALIQSLIQTYPTLSLEHITGHSDIAPIRKTDPGDFFDWQYLYILLSSNSKLS
jgi:AmpD protein